VSENKSKYKNFLLIILILVPISLILSLLILYQIISSYSDTFGKIENPILGLVIIILLIIVITLLSYTIVISVKEYHDRMIRRAWYYNKHKNMTLEEIFKNEHRRKIIKYVLEDPGIHHNELLRKCDIQKGQLQWHLDVLLKNNIIRKEKFGQYSIYFPLLNTLENVEGFVNGLTKSETTSRIFNLIKDNPGITSSEISIKINLARNSVKYHIDKLFHNDLIIYKKKGRKNKLYIK